MLKCFAWYTAESNYADQLFVDGLGSTVALPWISLAQSFMYFRKQPLCPLGIKNKFLMHLANSMTKLTCCLKSPATRLMMWLWQVIWTQLQNKHESISLKAFFV